MERPRGILKTESFEQDNKDVRVRFNEEELAEYDKLRGQKMKITEPKTPFEFSDPEEEEQVRALNQEKIDIFNKKIQEEFLNEKAEEENEEKRKEFERKRNQHYKNEFLLTKSPKSGKREENN